MTESLQKEYVQEEFKKMKTKNDNKTCADCLGKNPTWASIPYGILICMECASLHRSFGVHLTFVRSTLLDTWTAKQMKMMHLGGNENARNFFRQHGFEDQIDGGKLSQKYNSKAAELYRNKLKRMVEGGEEEKKTSYLKEQFQEKPTEEKKKPQQKQQQKDDFEDDDDDSDEFVTQKVSEKKSSSSNNSPQINVSKYSSNQKKNTTGISDKKKANVNFDAWDEWDDFDKSSDDEDSDEKSKKNKKNTKGGNNKKSNKKETVIPTRDNPKTYSHSLAYDDDDDQPEKKQEYQSPYQSKKDSNSSNNKNSSNSNEKSRYQRQPTTSSTTSQKSNSSSNSNRYESKTTSYDSSSNAQDRFKNAKSISSDQYFGTDKDITPQRQTKLNQFSSAKSISSSEYFGEEEEQSDFGSNIVETAKSDLNKLTSSLMTGGKKLAEMTKDFFNDFQDRYN